MAGSAQKSVAHSLHREINAAEGLKHDLAAMLGDDAELIADTIEGETSLHELIDQVNISMLDDHAVVDGCVAQIERLSARKDRAAKTIEAKRAMITRALVVAEKKTVPLATGTFTIRNTPANIVITEEADIPAEFWKDGKPSLDRKALKEAVQARDAEIKAAIKAKADEPTLEIDIPEPIPGVELDNGGISLTIKRS